MHPQNKINELLEELHGIGHEVVQTPPNSERQRRMEMVVRAKSDLIVAEEKLKKGEKVWKIIERVQKQIDKLTKQL